MQFLGLVYILYFVLPVLARDSRIFQRGFVSFALISPTLESAKFELWSLVKENKPIKLLESELANGGRLKNYVLGLCKNVDK